MCQQVVDGLWQTLGLLPTSDAQKDWEQNDCELYCLAKVEPG